MPTKNKNGEYVFSDAPEFKPNISPHDMFKMGSFGGTYWRHIYSGVTKKHYKRVHLDFPAAWWRGIPENYMTTKYELYDKKINKYGVKVGTSLEDWEEKGWITKHHPYGWVHWYCDYFQGKRGPDDERQIKRWQQTAGPNSRFRKWLIRLISEKKTKYNDYSVSPKIRQTLLHWGYELTSRDYNSGKK